MRIKMRSPSSLMKRHRNSLRPYEVSMKCSWAFSLAKKSIAIVSGKSCFGRQIPLGPLIFYVEFSSSFGSFSGDFFRHMGH